MRYPASEKLEIIRLVEQSTLEVRPTLEKLGIPRATFYRWYDRYQRGGPEVLEDRSPRPDRIWNRIPDDVRFQIVDLTLAVPELSPREAASSFTDQTTAPNHLWQTDFTYLKVIGWGWFYLSTMLDDYSRYIIAWKLCTTMKAEDVTDTLNLALQGQGLPRYRQSQAAPAVRQWVELHLR